MMYAKQWILGEKGCTQRVAAADEDGVLEERWHRIVGHHRVCRCYHQGGLCRG